jgi:uncharacterized protein YtpQ (UPF0354 family)
MSFFKRLFGGKKKEEIPQPETTPETKPIPTPTNETALPQQDLTKVFPYVKYCGGDSANLVGSSFTIAESKALVFEGRFTDKENKEHSLHIIERKLLPDCGLYYGFDHGMFFTGIMPNNFDEHLRLDNIDEIARENLSYFLNHTQKLEIHTADNGINMFVCGGNYESALLIYEDLWKDLQEQAKTFLYVAIPSRDMCLFALGNDIDAIDTLKAFVQEHYHQYPKALSKYLYKVQGAQWIVVEKIVD